MPNFDNYLGVDFGTKRVGIALSLNGLITPLPYLSMNQSIFSQINIISTENNVKKIFVGLSTGPLRSLQLGFVSQLSDMLKLPVETVDETATTIEAESLLKTNRRSKKSRDQLIDSVSAALILKRVIG